MSRCGDFRCSDVVHGPPEVVAAVAVVTVSVLGMIWQTTPSVRDQPAGSRQVIIGPEPRYRAGLWS